jgi:hypothetical protein
MEWSDREMLFFNGVIAIGAIVMIIFAVHAGKTEGMAVSFCKQINMEAGNDKEGYYCSKIVDGCNQKRQLEIDAVKETISFVCNEKC